MSTNELLGALLLDLIWSAVAALGFAMLFNVPRRWLAFCAALGALGHGTRWLLMNGGASIEIGTLMGALLVGFAGYALGRRLRVPTAIFHIPGIIPLVPGRVAYEAMIGLLQVTTATSLTVQQTLLAEFSVNAIRVGIMVAAIAIGIAIPRLLFDREAPVV
jgi:uncharacterized membrane protein YjjB (DUF3815 family)